MASWATTLMSWEMVIVPVSVDRLVWVSTGTPFLVTRTVTSSVVVPVFSRLPSRCSVPL